MSQSMQSHLAIVAHVKRTAPRSTLRSGDHPETPRGLMGQNNAPTSTDGFSLEFVAYLVLVLVLTVFGGMAFMVWV